MTMFNNNDLPLNRMQKLQQRAARKQATIKHDNMMDKALAIAYQNGDEEAGLQLLESYIDMVSYIYRYPHKAQYKAKAKISIDWTPEEKEDLFQEICLHFFTLVHEFDPKVAEFQAIIKGKLHLRVYDNFFEDVVDHKFNEIELDETMDFSTKAQEVFLDDEAVKKLPREHIELYQAFNQLSENQRKVLEASITKGWSAPEIATEFGLERDNVRQLLSRGMKRMKELMIKTEEA